MIDDKDCLDKSDRVALSLMYKMYVETGRSLRVKVHVGLDHLYMLDLVSMQEIPDIRVSEYQIDYEGIKLVESWSPAGIVEWLIAAGGAGGFIGGIAFYIKRLKLEELPPYLSHSNVHIREAAQIRYFILRQLVNNQLASVNLKHNV